MQWLKSVSKYYSAALIVFVFAWKVFPHLKQKYTLKKKFQVTVTLKPLISAFSRTNQNSLCPIQRFDTDIPMGLMELAACAIVGNEETVLFESSWRQQTSLFMNVHEHGIQVPERQRKCVRDVTQWL